MDFTQMALADHGFEGFVLLSDLAAYDVPPGPGVYIVLRPGNSPVSFLAESGAGWFKNRDPSASSAELGSAWIDGASVVYIGKAGAGKRGNRGLRKRLSEYRRHGAGEKIGHWGGRYVWQLADHNELVVAWMQTPDGDPEDVETKLIDGFVGVHGARPFANRKRGRSAQS